MKFLVFAVLLAEKYYKFIWTELQLYVLAVV